MEEANKNAIDFTLFSMKPQPEFELKTCHIIARRKRKA